MHDPGSTTTVAPAGTRVRPLEPDWTAERVFRAVSHLPHAAFLDSGAGPAHLSRYSFVAADPFQWVSLPRDAERSLSVLGEAVRLYSAHAPVLSPDRLPPFQGGAVMWFSYDLNQTFDRIAPPRYDQCQLPGICWGLYDVVFAFDHRIGQAWIISQGLPELDGPGRRWRAAEREAEFLGHLQAALNGQDSEPVISARWPAGSQPTPASLQTPQFPTWGPEELTSNFSKEAYLEAVGSAVEYVRAGDVFQVNLAQTLTHPATCDPVTLYGRLRSANPAPFAAYLDLGEQQVLSASPERFLQVVGRRVEARPIKGTRPRRDWPEADLFAAFDLQTSAKDRAENVMIVDLMRNDLARVCRPESIRVTQLCELEHYAFVQHLVSAIHGELPEDLPAEQLLAATFPGGSVTGAPKIRAMEIISQLEPTARGAYCGSLGYWSFSGTIDLNILIRTITVAGGWWTMPVGGGIVADSDPLREYEETWHKAIGLLRPVLANRLEPLISRPRELR